MLTAEGIHVPSSDDDLTAASFCPGCGEEWIFCGCWGWAR